MSRDIPARVVFILSSLHFPWPMHVPIVLLWLSLAFSQ